MQTPTTDQLEVERSNLSRPPGRASRWALRAIVLCALSWLACREWYFSAWMDDDAFISFRYARNLVRGLGLVFNPGEYVEGYTNFLWTMILAALHRLGADLPAAAQIMGALFSVLSVLLLLTWGREVLPPATAERDATSLWLGSLAAVLLCCLEPWAAWAVGGLENPLGAFVVLAAFLTYFRTLAGKGNSLATPGTLSALAALCHPSFALFGMVLGAHVLSRALRRKVRLRALIAFAMPILLIGLPYLVWRYSYYGHLLPNTFQAKVGFRWAVLARGASYYMEVFTGLPLLILTMVVTPIVPRLGGPRDARPWLLFAASIAYSCYAIAIGGEAFPAFRLLIVAFPLQLLLFQYLIALIAGGLNPRIPAASLLLPLAALLATLVPGYLSARVRVLDDAIQTDRLGLVRAASLQLKERFPADILLAGSGAGVIPFYSEYRFLDTLGLTDAHIAARKVGDYGAKTAGHEKGDGRYVLERNPDVILFGSGPVSGFEPCFLSDYELLAIPEFHDRYERMVLIVRFRPRNRTETVGNYMPLYVRKGVQIE